MNIFCENCGKELQSAQQFCTNCGMNFSTVQNEVKKNSSLKIIFSKIKISKIGKKNTGILLIIMATLVLISGVVFGISKYKSYFETREQKTIYIFTKLQQEKDDLIKKQQEELRIKSEKENEVLKKEIESLKNKSDNQVKNQKTTDTKLAELRDGLISSKVGRSNYSEQSSAVIGAIAKVYCDLDNNKNTTGSGSVWFYNGSYYLVTNYHVLQDANGINESCAITLARDWNAVAEDIDKAYEDDNLLIYTVNTSNYTYWEGLDLAISKLSEYEQPFSYLEDIALETNEAECNENFSPDTKIKIIGYPYTSSFTLPTITEGIVSSWENIGDAGYYVTSAKIEHGNSGGIAVTENYYCTVGIPSAVVVGSSESLGRILVLNEMDLKYLFENLIE